MDNIKVTPGEWKVKHSESKTAFNIVGTALGGKYKIARIPYPVYDNMTKINEREKAEAEADAKLIAAAPELLKALQKITEMNYQTAEDQYGDRNKAKNWSCVTVAEAAIKKALE